MTINSMAKMTPSFQSLTLNKTESCVVDGTAKDAKSDSLVQIYNKLTSDLNQYLVDWKEMLKNSSSVIDTGPAQATLKALQPVLTSLSSSAGNIQSSNDADVYSDWEIYDYVCTALGVMQTDYMDVYEQVTEKYQEYMSDVNSFKSSISEYMTADDDSVDLDMAPIDQEINDIIAKWTTTPILTVDTEAEAAYWQDQLGLPYSADADGSGYSFYVNTQPLQDIKDATDALPDDGNLSTARFNQWQNSINSSCSTVESDTQIIAQKFSQANTIFNNLTKILSSTMDSLYQTDKTFLQN